MSARKKQLSQRQRIAGILITVCIASVVVFLQPLLGRFGINLYELMGISTPSTAVSGPVEGGAEVHFIDVGQASCILIVGSEKTALIDGGENKTADAVAQYLEQQGVTQLDYFFNTHPHSDHVGGCRAIMQQVPTAQFIMPELNKKIVPTTATYEKLLVWLDENRATTQTHQAQLDERYDLGGGLTLTVIGPLALYEDLNEASLVIRMDFGDTSFLFTGDMEAGSQHDMAASLEPVTVLSSPHHGSDSSLDEGFLRTAAPQYAVISCGKDNDYGHPHKETLELYKKLGMTVYRTDQRGTIKMITNGEAIVVETERSSK